MKFDWRTIVALNAVSTLAQIGQFGIAYVMLPVWLADRGLDATQLGFFASSLWLGQFPGLAVAPWLSRRLGATPVILLGLLCTLISLGLIPFTDWPLWLLAGALAGFGLGLRWIGLEPWLYHIAPSHARGRLVGFHETLIGLAPIIAPALAGWAGVRGHAIFWIGIAFTVSALVPLAFTQKERAGAPRAEDAHQHNHQPGGRDGIFKVGIVIALLGGMIEAALSGLFPLFAQRRDLTVENTADLLTMFGIGGLLMQYAVGWLADHKGLAYAATTCAAGTVLITAAMAFPLNYLALTLAVFLLGGTITAFLTLAIIASTTTTSGSLAGNVSLVSMVYTGSAVVGPLLAGTAMHALRADALVWFLGAAALVMGLAVYAVGNLNNRRR